MTYSDFTHFSDKNSYKTLFISSYQTKDMNFTSLEHLQEFFRKLRKWWDFSHRERYQPGSLTNWAGWPDWIVDCCAGAGIADEEGPHVRSRGNKLVKSLA
jgi:hypothetical protein